MSVFEVRVTFAVETADADAAAEAFGDWLAMTKTTEVEVRNTDTGHTQYIDVQL